MTEEELREKYSHGQSERDKLVRRRKKVACSAGPQALPLVFPTALRRWKLEWWEMASGGGGIFSLVSAKMYILDKQPGRLRSSWLMLIVLNLQVYFDCSKSAGLFWVFKSAGLFDCFKSVGLFWFFKSAGLFWLF